MQTGEVIMTALGILKTKGWCAGAFQNAQGECCAQGAVALALGVRPNYVPSVFWCHQRGDWDAVMAALAQQIPSSSWDGLRDIDDCGLVAEYNNSQKDSGVIEAWFEKAAANEGCPL